MTEPLLSSLKEIISGRLSLGVIILDERGDILYLNEKALSILSLFSKRQLSFDHDPSHLNEAVISCIRQHLGSLTASRSACVRCEETDTTFALRAMPLSEPRRQGAACTLVLIEGVTMHHSFDLSAVQKKFRLTKRETEVTYCLTRGLTNKEIAAALSISPETVHGYIKQIMKKMRTTTRAGIVGKVLP